MDINLLLRGGNLNPLPGRPAPEQQLVRKLLNSLKPGQLLLAKVLAQPRPDIARLLIQDIAVSAHTSRPLPAGQQVRLTVLKTGDTPELRVLEPQRALSSQDVLRLALPRQLPLRDTLAGLRELAPRLMPVLSGSARDIFKTLLDNTPALRDLTPKQLRQQVRDSGIFTETRMAAGQPPESGDRKVLLMRLAAALPRPATPTGQPTAAAPAGQTSQANPIGRALLLGAAAENIQQAAAATSDRLTPEQLAIQRLWQLVDAGIARIQTQQAASLPADRDSRPAFQLEIPLALPGGELQAVELRIEQEEARQEEDGETGETGWLVTIGFRFEALGAVKAGVRLADGRIYTTFWCEQADAVARFERMLPALQRNLEAAGLDVGGLAASQGTPPIGDAGLRPRSQLLDERV